MEYRVIIPGNQRANLSKYVKDRSEEAIKGDERRSRGERRGPEPRRFMARRKGNEGREEKRDGGGGDR